MPSLEQLHNRFAANRDFLLEIALEDSRKYCRAPEKGVEGRDNQDSDQHWVEVFSQPGVTAETAHSFLRQFQLTNRVGYDKQRVADRINALIGASMTDPIADIHTLSRDLPKCIESGNRNQQTSAASKLSMFAKPNAMVFIWDRLATKSAKLRDWHGTGRDERQNGLVRLNDLYKDGEREKGNQHRYDRYWAACLRALEQERSTADFPIAVKAFSRFLTAENGPMRSGLVEAHFIERRLLDKLMFWEGYYIEKWAKNWSDGWEPEGAPQILIAAE